MHGDDEIGRPLQEMLAAFEHALLLYAHIRTRYAGARFDEETLKRAATAPMLADVVALRESQERVVAAVQRLLAWAVAADVPAARGHKHARDAALTHDQWFTLGMRVGRDLAAAAGRGQTVDVRALRSGKWT